VDDAQLACARAQQAAHLLLLGALLVLVLQGWASLSDVLLLV
jgi:hypothetical protein